MRYINLIIALLIAILGFFIGNLIHIGYGSGVFIGGFLGIILACSFLVWRGRPCETSSSSLLDHELLQLYEARKSKEEFYMHQKFDGGPR